MTQQADKTDTATGQTAEVPPVNAVATMATRHRRDAEQARAAFAAALRVAFGRMAADVPGLDAAVQKIETRQGGLAEVLELPESGAFLAVLEGQGDRMGLLLACPKLMTSAIEALTTGRVDTAPPPHRKPTRTDAALIAPMIDAFLRLAEQGCADLAQAGLMAGYAYGSCLDDPRPLGLMLEEGQYHILHLRVSLGFGARDGDWFVILPDPVSSAAPHHEVMDDAAAERDWQARLDTAISNSEVVVTAMLGRVQFTLTDALRLRPGDILRLPESALELLTLETINQSPVAIGRLGQTRGQRAIRLTADPGVMTDALGAQAPQVALPAQVLPFTPPQAAFVPDPPPDAQPAAGPAPDPTTAQSAPAVGDTPAPDPALSDVPDADTRTQTPE